MADGFHRPRVTLAPWALVANSAAGAVRDGRIEAIRRRLGARLAQIEIVSGPDLKAALADAAARGAGAVLTLGGDGTARTALETLTPLGVAVAPLPGGTLNRLTANLYRTRSLAGALAQLERAEPRWIAGGAVGARRFFVAAGFGAAMRLVRVREALRRGRLSTAARDFAAEMKALLREPLALGEERRQAHLALAGVGPLDAAFGLAPRQPVRALELAAGRFAHLGALLGLAPFALLGGWRSRENVAAAAVTGFTIAAQAPIPTLMDGEFSILPPQAEIRYEPQAGLALLPPATS